MPRSAAARVKIVERMARKIVVPAGKRDVIVFDRDILGFHLRMFRDRACGLWAGL
jgi:hypothetical protein